MKFLMLCLFALQAISTNVFSQPPFPIFKQTPGSIVPDNRFIPKRSAENCFNNIDDDGNGLTDMKDYACYFSSLPPNACPPTKIIWGCYPSQLYWVDLETNLDRVIDFPLGEVYYDITWSPNGKLYGPERFSGNIREIDPLTAQTQFASNVPGNGLANGITADSEGNLFITSLSGTGQWHVIKLSLTTNQSSIVANLSAHNLVSAGDLTFVNNSLYVACEDNKIAKIDINTGNVLTFTMTGAPPFLTGYGLTTLGDGFLYISSESSIYRVDPSTMTASFYYQTPTFGIIYGLTSYSEHCNAPVCKAEVDIAIQSSIPYCSNTGVNLKGTGTGINGPSGYTWTLPSGDTVAGDALTAFVSGKYYLRYHSLPDFCDAVDSVELNIIEYPEASLQNDTVLCRGTEFQLVPRTNGSITTYLWQDGSSAPQFTVNQPGLYWLESSNACGAVRDSVIITDGRAPFAYIGPDTLICPASSIVIRNGFPKDAGDIYTWSTSSHADSIIITQPGLYWLIATNSCGVAKDSIVITQKDSCICNPLFPAINLGPDRELCQYDTMILSNSLHNPDFRYSWNDGSRSNSLVVKQPGKYWVTVSTHCGEISDTVIIRQKTIDCECFPYIPSAFTPNNDGKNDMFKALSNCSMIGEMKIFNRWGNLVYSTKDIGNGWDGYYKGSLQPNDVYIYYLDYIFPTRPGRYSKKGTFLLLR